MTFDEMVTDVAERLNKTSAEALARIGVHLNRRYKRVSASIGMRDSRRVILEFDVELGSRTQTVTGIEKIIGITDNTDTVPRPLDEITYEQMVQKIVRTDRVESYAIVRHGARQVSILLDFEPLEDLTLDVEAEEVATSLADDMEPSFPESFHDVLVFGALADEYRKSDKVVQARDAELDFQRVLSELRLKLACSAFKTIQQGAVDSNSVGWPRKSSV